MDVTQEIRKNHAKYGSSDLTTASTLASSKSLNYSSGATITKPEENLITQVPRIINYQDTVGLFGVENHFVKISIEAEGNFLATSYEEEGWSSATIVFEELSGDYITASINRSVGTEVDNTFVPATDESNPLPSGGTKYALSVELINNKTGNKYIDSWLDVRLYNSDKEEHPFDTMYVKTDAIFYIGFHARNTRRLPYNVSCTVGREFREVNSITDKSYIARNFFN
tara:strand:- start:133 stop:810 length:678 start_codon:yes stop_codon:yes gene_type:complete